LDHVSGFVINTAAFHNTSRPKKLAGLPSTVNAIKIHLFNDVIWPNLTDEDGGVGFVTFQRLADGGNIAVGEGYGSGYIEVCDGLCVRGMKISHGHCSKPPSSGSHRDSDVGLSEATHSAFRNPSADSGMIGSRALRTPSFTVYSQPGTPGAPPTSMMQQMQVPPPPDFTNRKVTVDSTAYFIRDDATGREVLIFGDVEPDSISLNPRTATIWAEAAPRIVTGVLKAICIECSYEDSQQDAVLFGHLAPRHVVKELQTLGEMVRARRVDEDVRREAKKRKRAGNDAGEATGGRRASCGSPAPTTSGFFRMPHVRMPSVPEPVEAAPPPPPSTIAKRRGLRSTRIVEFGNMSPKSKDHVHAVPGADSAGSSMPHTPGFTATPPLAGVTVIVMHMKDTLRDGPAVGASILRQLKGHEARLKETDGVGLGCKFEVSRSGGSYYF